MKVDTVAISVPTAKGTNGNKKYSMCGEANHFAQVSKSPGAAQNANWQGKPLRELRAETNDFYLRD